MITIREATESDATIVASLSRELGYEASEEETLSRLAALQASARNRVFVAENDGAVVAWCHVSVVESLVHDPYVEIRGLVVTEWLRSAGIGAALVARAEEWAIDQDVNDMRVRSNVVRERARHFYEKLGYKVTKTSNSFEKRV